MNSAPFTQLLEPNHGKEKNSKEERGEKTNNARPYNNSSYQFWLQKIQICETKEVGFKQIHEGARVLVFFIFGYHVITWLFLYYIVILFILLFLPPIREYFHHAGTTTTF
jgi:hypothetical protein